MIVRIESAYITSDVVIKLGQYQNGSTAIQGFLLNGEPAFIATVALDQVPENGKVFLKGWSENKGIPESLERAGVVKLTGKTIPTGYVEALEAELLLNEEDTND